MDAAREYVLVVGVNMLAEFYTTAVKKIIGNAVEIVGIVSNDVSAHGKRLGSYPVLGHDYPHFFSPDIADARFF